MIPVHSNSKRSVEAFSLIQSMQSKFAENLIALHPMGLIKEEFKPVTWLRNSGINGSGTRLVSCGRGLFNRAYKCFPSSI